MPLKTPARLGLIVSTFLSAEASGTRGSEIGFRPPASGLPPLQTLTPIPEAGGYRNIAHLKISVP